MYLDAAEEKMLRAIVQSAVAVAAGGRPFVGEFRHYVISATRLQVNDDLPRKRNPTTDHSAAGVKPQAGVSVPIPRPANLASHH